MSMLSLPFTDIKLAKSRNVTFCFFPRMYSSFPALSFLCILLTMVRNHPHKCELRPVCDVVVSGDVSVIVPPHPPPGLAFDLNLRTVSPIGGASVVELEARPFLLCRASR